MKKAELLKFTAYFKKEIAICFSLVMKNKDMKRATRNKPRIKLINKKFFKNFFMNNIEKITFPFPIMK